MATREPAAGVCRRSFTIDLWVRLVFSAAKRACGEVCHVVDVHRPRSFLSKLLTGLRCDVAGRRA